MAELRKWVEAAPYRFTVVLGFWRKGLVEAAIDEAVQSIVVFALAKRMQRKEFPTHE